MPKSTDLLVNQGPLTAIIISRPGGGKTALASSFPRWRCFDFDKKMGAIFNPAWLKLLGRLPDGEWRTFSENKRHQGFAIMHNSFDDACRYFDECMNRKNDFDYFIVDSVTNLSEAAYNKALIVLGGQKLSSTYDTASKTGMAMLKKQDFGGGNSLVIQFVRMLLDSGKGVILTAHERETTNEGGIVTQIDPMFIGQNVQAIPALFQNVWRLKITGVPPNHKRLLQCDGDGISMARSELGLGSIDEPTYDKIIARIKERLALIPRPEGTPPSGGTSAPSAPAP